MFGESAHHVFMYHYNKSFIFISSVVIVIRSLIVLSSSNWLFIWIAIEINILRFIPIIVNSKNNQETEAAIKYFIAQALGSRIILIRSISLWFISINSYLLIITLASAIILKLGIAPFHFWFPSVITSISWISCLILATWQKMAPLIILTFTINNLVNSYLLIAATINALIGGILGINQSHIRTIIAYSSITHIGWIARIIYVSKPFITFSYFILYCLIITPLFIIFNKFLSSTNKQFNKINFISSSTQLIIPLLLLSLSGIPPLSGFIPKWLTIYTVSSFNPILIIILIIGAIINTYFYLNIVFNSILSINIVPIIKSSYYSININLFISIASLSIIFLPLLIIPIIYALIIFY